MMFSNTKSGKGVTLFTKFVAGVMSVVVFTLISGAVIDRQAKHVTLVTVNAFDGTENSTDLISRQNTVSGLIEETGLAVGEYDRLSMLPEDELYSGARGGLRKGRKFTVNIDGGVQILTTTKKTVSEAFTENGITVGATDRVEPDINSEVISDMTVNVYRVAYRETMEEISIPFEIVEEANPNLYKGTTKITTKGQNGLKKISYKITTENGVETGREITGETIVSKPVTQVVSVGTKEKPKVTKSGKPLSYSKKLTVTATAYSAKAGAKTASGKAAQYGVIAVDPKVIPLGSKLYVESTNDGVHWTYGYCIAGDTGGAIKGNKIDLFYNSESQCLQFGRRSATVYILN